MVIFMREINNKYGKMKTGILYTIVYIYAHTHTHTYIFIYIHTYIYIYNIYIFKPHTYQHTNTHIHNIYNIFCISQYYSIEAVQFIYWIHVDKNRI